MEDLVSRIVDQIVQDLRDRPRLGYVWERTNLETQQNIRAAWASIVREEVRLYNASDEWRERGMSYARELQARADAAKAQEKRAKAALRTKGKMAKFWTPHYNASGGTRHGEFVELSCNGCNRWEECGHAANCPVAELEKLQKKGLY